MPGLPLGIMRSETDALQQLKKEIYLKDKPFQTLASRIGELSETERANIVRIAKIVLAFQRENVRGKGYSDIDYMGLIDRLRQGLQPHLKVLLSDVLNELEPVKVIKKPKPDYREALLKMYDQDERFKTPLPKYDLPLQKPFDS